MNTAAGRRSSCGRADYRLWYGVAVAAAASRAMLAGGRWSRDCRLATRRPAFCLIMSVTGRARRRQEIAISGRPHQRRRRLVACEYHRRILMDGGTSISFISCQAEAYQHSHGPAENISAR